MSQLIPVEYKNQRIMTTKVLAEQFGTEDRRITENYQRNKERFSEGKHFYKLEGDELKVFKASTLLEGNLKFAPELYLWTERGAARHAKILETDEAWQVYENLEETYFRIKENPFENLSKELKAIFITDQKVQKLETHVAELDEKVENQITVTYNQANEIQKAVASRVIELLGGKETKEYRNNKGSYFSQLHRDLKDRLGVPSYRDIRKIDYNAALAYIKAWLPKATDKSA